MNTILTYQDFIDLGFEYEPKASFLLQDGYKLILQDKGYNSLISSSLIYIYRALSITLCNDKSNGEYYLFLIDGQSNNRQEDSIVTITRNLLYKEDLIEFIRILNL